MDAGGAVTKLKFVPDGAQAGNMANLWPTSRGRTRPLAISTSIGSQLYVPPVNSRRFPSGGTAGEIAGKGLAKIRVRRAFAVSRILKDAPSAVTPSTTTRRLSGIQLIRMAAARGNRCASPDGYSSTKRSPDLIMASLEPSGEKPLNNPAPS